VQFFCYDAFDLNAYAKRLASYVPPELRDKAYGHAFLKTMSDHLAQVCRPQGLFHDKAVTDTPFAGRERHVRLVIYRRWPRTYQHPAGLSPIQELNDTARRFESALAGGGIALTRLDDNAFCEWLLPWFNPHLALTEGRLPVIFGTADRAGQEPPKQYLAESLFFDHPRSDQKTQTWWFDERPHRCIAVERFRRAPEIGLLTAERTIGDRAYALFDRLPRGTVMVLTLVVIPQDRLETRINQIEARAVGESMAVRETRQDAETAKDHLARDHKLFRAQLAFYVRGANIDDLRQKSNTLASVLLSHGLEPVAPTADPIGLSTYLANLPMVYDPNLDPRGRFGRLMWTQHLANLAPVYGRSRGTGRPGFTFFNRGAEPLAFDPLSPADRRKNGHLLLLGPTGAGKSATLVSLMAQVMATVRPRLYIIEAGNSFGLLADYFRSLDLSVHRVTLKVGENVSLPPFADAVRLPDALLNRDSLTGALADTSDSSDALDELTEAADGAVASASRDLLGEMELIALIMITGGELAERERLTRSDRRTVRDAICRAARYARAHHRPHVLTEDVVTALVSLSFDQDLSQRKRERAEEMADAMALFCDGLEGELFNRPGRSWPDVDVTLIDLATFSREGYEAQLAVAYTSVMNAIHNRIERHQNDARPTIMVTDEGHIITTNPLLAPYVVKVVKMWRKLGAWYWIATQNLEDFPDAAKRLLNMIEWWLCLVMPKEEVDQIARFKALGPDHKRLLLSARKEPGQYTEGVVLSDTVEALFRHVPPPLYLALAMTEKHEKAERQRLMDQDGLSEVEAALEVAEGLIRKEAP
jgi:conjugative transfer ATPase